MKRILHISIALLLLAVAGQNAWATTKTVTYTLSRVEIDRTHYWALTHSGDTPFDGTTTVEKQLEDNATYATFQLPDGFTFTFTWGSGATVTSVGSGGSTSYFYCGNANVKFSLAWGTHRYVTAVSITDDKGNSSPLNGNGTASSNFKYSDDRCENGQVSYTLKTYANFVKLNITYTDAPDLSVFEKAGDKTYNIKSAADLRHLADYVNNGGNKCSGLTFQQTQDITCDNTYIPIGYHVSNSDEASFQGTYDGDGKTISGITVNRTGSTKADGCVGLFGYVEYNKSSDYGTVRNVVLANSTFTGRESVGGIVGWNDGGTVENCRVESTVTINAGQDIANHHGGIVGKNALPTAKVIGCYSAAAVSVNGKSGTYNYGGIVGNNNKGIVKDCLYAGTTVTSTNDKGAIVGFDEDKNGAFSNNYYTAISLGGVNGADADGARRAYTVTLGNNVSLAGAETAYSTSGLTAIGSGNYALRSGSTTYSGAGQTLTLSYTGGDVPDGKALRFSYNDGTDHAIDGNSFTMPAHNVTVSATLVDDPWGIIADGADGSADHPYRISSTAGLDLLATNVNSGVSTYSDKHFLQTENLTYDGTENNFTAIGNKDHAFSGHYDGGEKTISGININKTGTDANADCYLGIFGSVVGGTIERLALAGSTIVGYRYVGGIAGYLNGTIQNCRVEANVTLSTESQYNSYQYFGGVAGRLDQSGIIQGCVCGASVNSRNGRILYCGGIVGSSGGTLRSNVYFGTSVYGISTMECGAILGEGYYSYNNYYTATSGVPKGKGNHENSNNSDVMSESSNASRAKLLTLGEHVAIVGDEVKYTFSGLTDLGGKALIYNDGNSVRTFTHTEQTVTLCYDDDVPAGKSAAFSCRATFQEVHAMADYPISGTEWNIQKKYNSNLTNDIGAYDAFTINATLVSNTVTITAKPALGGYWTTFYSSAGYIPSGGAVAYIVNSSGQLSPLQIKTSYNKGTQIRGCVAVVIFSDKPNVTLTRNDEIPLVSVVGNILLGSDDPVPVVNGKVDGKTPYVLGVVDGVFGFHPFTGSEIPANKAYFLKSDN